MPAPMRYPRQWEWPNKAKIAMTVNLAMEAFKFKSQYTQDYPLTMAGAAITMLPIIVVYLLFQRQFVQGLTSGAFR